MTGLSLTVVAVAGLLTGGAIALRRQGKPLQVQLVPAVLAAALLALAVAMGAFGGSVADGPGP